MGNVNLGGGHQHQLKDISRIPPGVKGQPSEGPKAEPIMPLNPFDEIQKCPDHGHGDGFPGLPGKIKPPTAEPFLPFQKIDLKSDVNAVLNAKGSAQLQAAMDFKATVDRMAENADFMPHNIEQLEDIEAYISKLKTDEPDAEKRKILHVLENTVKNALKHARNEANPPIFHPHPGPNIRPLPHTLDPFIKGDGGPGRVLD